MSWGREIVYTYGPLGFIDVPQVWNLASLIGGLFYGFAAIGAIVCVPFILLRDKMSLFPALVLTAAIALNVPPFYFLPEVLSLGAFVLAAGFFQGVVDIRPSLLAAVFGGLVAFQALVKPPTTTTALLGCMLVITAPRPGRRSRLIVSGAAFLVMFFALWLGTGQPIGNVARWLASVSDFARYYSEATWLAPADRQWEIIAALLLTAGLAAYSMRYAVRMPGRIWWLLIGAYVVVLWLMFKEGFVKQDVHTSIFFFAVVLLAVGIRTRVRALAELGTIVAAGLLLSISATSLTISNAMDPRPGAHTFRTLVHYIASPHERADVTAAARAALQADYGLPEQVREAAATGTVHVDPDDTSLAWAYDFRWRPVPIFQRYAAHSGRLDQMNADALETQKTAPDRIIRRESTGFEGRNDLWDSPRYMLNLVCFYRQTMVTPPWQLLTRERSRCGPMRLGPPIAFKAGDQIPVPEATPHDLVVVWMDLDTPLSQRLRTAIFRPSSRILVTTPQGEYRVATTQVAGPLLMRVPSAVGWDSRFGGGAEYQRLRVNRDGTARFATIPVTPAQDGS